MLGSIAPQRSPLDSFISFDLFLISYPGGQRIALSSVVAGEGIESLEIRQ